MNTLGTGDGVTKKFSVKNLNSECCIQLLSQSLKEKGIQINYIKPGQVCITYNQEQFSTANIHKILKESGFSVITDREETIVEQIKIAVFELIHLATNSNSIIRNSDYLVDKLQLSYQYLSSIFSKHESITLEKFIILHKIEKVKELLMEGELTLSEIAYQMEYSSVQYLSTQFKHITGVSVSDFKKNPTKYIKTLDSLTEISN